MAMIEGQDRPGGRRDKLTVVCGDENRGAIGVNLVEGGPCISSARTSSKFACRLIGQDQGWFIDQRACQCNSLLLPPRQLLREEILFVRDPYAGLKMSATCRRMIRFRDCQDPLREGDVLKSSFCGKKV